MEMDYKISGIPCIIRLIEVDEDGIDWEVRDRKGYMAYWLAAKLTMKAELDITNELIARLKHV
jgi:hypothetical protein